MQTAYRSKQLEATKEAIEAFEKIIESETIDSNSPLVFSPKPNLWFILCKT